MSLPKETPSGGATNRPPRRWAVTVVIALLLPAFVGVSLIDPARLTSFRRGEMYGPAGPGGKLSTAGVSVRWHSTQLIRNPDADDVAEPLPRGTGLAVVSFDIAWHRRSSRSAPFCIVRIAGAEGRVWTHSPSTTSVGRMLDTGAELPGNQNCFEAVDEQIIPDHWYRLEVRMAVADDISEPLTTDIWDGWQRGRPKYFRFRST